MQEFQCNGIWWLPQNPSDKVGGTLHFSDGEGGDLSLAGILGESTQRFEEKLIPIILGLVWDCPLGRLVTLRDCRIKGTKFGVPGITREQYRANCLFFGSHFTKEEDFSFSELGVVLSGLSSWADDLTGLIQSHVPVEEGRHGGFEIRWLSPAPIHGEIPGGRLTLSVGSKLTMVRRDWSIREHVLFEIACEGPQAADELNRKYVYPLQNLMTLATDHPNALVEFIVRRPDSRDDIQVLRPRMFHDAELAADLLRHQMLFSLKDVRSRTIDLIGKWIEVSERLSGACDPYFGIQYEPGSFVDTKLLLVFQSLEVYQRQRHPKDQSGLSPNSSLPDLLSRLLEEHWVVVGPLFGESQVETVAKVMRYRNYVVHRDSDLGDSPHYMVNFYWLTQKLMFLMKSCWLDELGVSPAERVELFRQNQLYVHIVGLARK